MLKIDTRLSDDRDHVPNSPNYIQNDPGSPQSGSFNLNGTGTAHILNAVTQLNIGGLRMLVANGPYDDGIASYNKSNTFLGDGAGLNTAPDPTLNSASGKFNSFFGVGAGETQVAMTNTSGFYRFDEVEVGETYIVSATAKRFEFAPHVLVVRDEITGLDFIAGGI